MATTLSPIEKIEVAEKPPKGSRQVGVSPAGKIVWELEEIRGRNEPDIDPETGKQRYEVHPLNLRPLYPRRRLYPQPRKRVFTLEQDGQGNLYMQDFRFPTPEELEEKRIADESARLLPTLARMLISQGFTADTLAARLAQGVNVAPQPEPEPEGPSSETLSALAAILDQRNIDPDEFVDRVMSNPVAVDTSPAVVDPGLAPDPKPVVEDQEQVEKEPEITYPLRQPGGWWKLSNGTRVKGTQIEATAAEIALHRAPSNSVDVEI